MSDTAVSVRAWSVGVRQNPEVRRAARFVAWFLADWPLFGRVGCQATDAEIAAEICAAENTVKNALLQLRSYGHIDWTWRRIRGRDVRTIVPILLPDQPAAPHAVAAPALSVGADADFTPAELGAAEPEPAECRPEQTTASEIDDRDETGRNGRKSRQAPLPFSDWQRYRQRARIQNLIEALPDAGWYARCSESGCGARAAFICADEGATFCRTHRRYACHSVPLSAFGLGAEAWAGRPEGDGDFRGW